MRRKVDDRNPHLNLSLALASLQVNLAKAEVSFPRAEGPLRATCVWEPWALPPLRLRRLGFWVWQSVLNLAVPVFSAGRGAGEAGRDVVHGDGGSDAAPRVDRRHCCCCCCCCRCRRVSCSREDTGASPERPSRRVASTTSRTTSEKLSTDAASTIASEFPSMDVASTHYVKTLSGGAWNDVTVDPDVPRNDDHRFCKRPGAQGQCCEFEVLCTDFMPSKMC